MNEQIELAIDELNTNVEKLLIENNTKIEEIEKKLVKQNDHLTLPMSENVKGKETYEKSDFLEYLRKGVDDMHHKSLNHKIGADGGHFIPTKVVSTINDRLAFLSPMRSIARRMTISTNAIEMIVDSKMPDAGWASSDATVISETNSPTIEKIKIPVHEIFAKPKASQKLLDDAQINIEEWLIGKISEKIASIENDAFVKGDGSDKPFGFLSYKSDAAAIRDANCLQHFITGSKGGVQSAEKMVDVLIDVTCSIKPQYVKNAKWIMSRSALAEIRKLKNKDGVCLWQPSLSSDALSTLLGYEVVLDDDMPIIAKDKDSVPIAFGDFYSGYQIVDRQGIKILRDPFSAKPFVEFYATKRTGGAVVDFDAIKLVKFADK